MSIAGESACLLLFGLALTPGCYRNVTHRNWLTSMRSWSTDEATLRDLKALEPEIDDHAAGATLWCIDRAVTLREAVKRDREGDGGEFGVHSYGDLGIKSTSVKGAIFLLHRDCARACPELADRTLGKKYADECNSLALSAIRTTVEQRLNYAREAGHSGAVVNMWRHLRDTEAELLKAQAEYPGASTDFAEQTRSEMKRIADQHATEMERLNRYFADAEVRRLLRDRAAMDVQRDRGGTDVDQRRRNDHRIWDIEAVLMQKLKAFGINAQEGGTPW